ncbi:MAG TPA: hypothetical protein VMU94_04065 [Streptosporangiaceae bacterium]|nr:hypothetical protein [Streptosporangiaceae bacterium]
MSDSADGWEDAELAALGRIAANFAELDWQAGRMLAGFISPRDVAAILTAGADLRWTLEKLSVIAAEALGDPLASSTLLAWVKASRDLADRRNQLTHSFYLPRAGGQSLARMKASTRGGKWKGQSEPVGLADLSEVADLLAEGLEVADQLVEHLTSCPEWQDPAAPSSRKPPSANSVPAAR